ncbi:hypothetical protein KKA14_12645 [bacterium]|nr:hypothetical protein [bacterium]
MTKNKVQTRKEIFDIKPSKVGWDVADRTWVAEEFDIEVPSDGYIRSSGTFQLLR